MSATGYRKGAHYVICDSCGMRDWSYNMVKKWNGSIVHSSAKCFETRHPQDTIQPHSDNPAVEMVRNPADRFIGGGTVVSADKFITAPVKANDL